MRCLVFPGLLLAFFSGCFGSTVPVDPTWQTSGLSYSNPVLLPAVDHRCVWETMVDVVDDYFPKMQREEPVRLVGNILTEGRLDTFPIVGSTILEPWRRDSVGRRERLESTFQSIRRRAVVRVIPAENGYWVDVAVFKELEDVARPVHATVGDATFRNDTSLTRVVNPVGQYDAHEGWIDLGRDAALEQEILGQLSARIGGLTVR